MAKTGQLEFYIYRYQILPISQTLQLSTDLKYESISELLADKNKIFGNAVLKMQNLKYERTEFKHRHLFTEKNIYVKQFAVNRNLKRSKPDFTEEEIDNWPRVMIVFWNEPNQQKIYIQKNQHAFGHPNTFADILEANFNSLLKHSQLQVYLEPLFEKNEFWSVVKRYPTQIVLAKFELISPNMSNISGGLKFDLAQLHRNTNTKKTNIEMQSDKNGSLTLNRSDEFIESLVNYASEGGGNIVLKIRGLKKRIQTSKNVTETSIDELDVVAGSEEDISRIVSKILK